MRTVISRATLLVLVSLSAAGPVHAVVQPNLQTLFGNSQPVACNAASQSFDMVNPTNVPIYVKKVAMWHGIDFSKTAVLTSSMRRISDNMLLLDFNDQRFARPNGSTQLTTDFTPDYFTLGVGDALRVTYSCIAVSSGSFNVQVLGTAWYTTIP